MVFRINNLRMPRQPDDVRYVKIENRYPNSHCFECEQDILEGESCIYDTRAKKVYCSECGRDLVG